MATDRRKYKTAWQAKKRHEIREERAREGDPVTIGRPPKQVPFIKDSKRLDAIATASLKALKRLHWDNFNNISWRLFKWHAVQAFVANSSKAAPSDAELLLAFKMLLKDGYVLPTGYSRRGFPLVVSRKASGE